jgi:hypothetical protein
VTKTKTRIMYIENKSEGMDGPARIGRVTFSKTGKTLHYRDKAFRSLKGVGFKANYLEIESGDQYWISGPHKDGSDRLYGGSQPVHVDDDVADEYWTQIRGQTSPPRKRGRTEAPQGVPAVAKPHRIPKWGRASAKAAKILARG